MSFRNVCAVGLTGVLTVGSLWATAPTALGVDSAGTSRDRIDRIIADLHRTGPGVELLIAAHRGQWREAPENSLPAIEAAIEDGAHVVELDVRLTSDGVPVLMHDETVDRTTNGTGRIDELTLAQVRELRLKKGLGGAQASVTQEFVPTLAEAMDVLRGRAMINLDKAWPFRDEVLQVLRETDTVDHGLFKGSPDVAEADAFMAAHPDVLYMHIVNDASAEQAFEFTTRNPVAVEVVFDSVDDPQAQPEYLARLQEQSRVWINTMWGTLAADNTDEASLRADTELGWDVVVDTYLASMIQTDNLETIAYWMEGNDPTTWGLQPGGRSLRIQAETPAPGGQGVAYHDNDENRCANISPAEPMLDICSQRGALVLGWIRGGEWVTYQFEVPQAGMYDVSARVSSPYSPAGTVQFTWDGQPGAVHEVGNTTNHSAFEVQGIERRHFEAGAHTLRIDMPEGVFQNFNIDYFQLDLVESSSAGDIPVRAEIPALGDDGDGGSLVLSVAPGSADLGTARNAGDRLRLSGLLPAVAVTDSRADAAGWSVTGQASALTSADSSVGAARIGWAPFLVDGRAVPGAAVAPDLAGGPGLAVPATLGTAAGEHRTGTAALSADLTLEVPVDTKAGSYAGYVTVSLFPED